MTGTRIGIAAGFLLVLLAVGLCYRGVELAHYESAAQLKDFRDDLNVARLMLGARSDDADQIQRRTGGGPTRPQSLSGGR